MTLKEILNQVALWNRLAQIKFCKHILFQITIGIRSIWSDETTTCEAKLEGIKWLNEFNHRINNFIFRLETSTLQDEIDIYNIGYYANNYAKLSAITKGNIAAIISAAYNQTIETNGIEIYN